VVLTGYPAYPLAVLPAPVGWRLPQEELAILQGWIRSWARAPGLRPEQVLGGHGWVGPWASTLLGNRVWVQVPLALLAAGAAALLVSRRSRLLPALAAPLAGIGYWLLTAPDVRFLGATLWLLAACALAIAAVSARGPAAPRVVRAVAALLALGVLAGAWRRGDLLLRPDPVAGFHPTPAAPVRARELRSGLAVQVPQGGRDCFYAPLPCAADVHPGLRLRGQGLRSGFVREP
jgi:hypothetical protein